MLKKWKIREEANPDFFNQFKEYPRVILQLLWNRDLKNKEAIEKFLNPQLSDLFSPDLMLNMKKGAKRITQAIENNERMAIYGDYDTDGICAAVILAQGFKRFGFENFDVFIPNRFRGGYGLTIERLEEIAKDGVKLVISVDCGITDVEEVNFAKKLGLEVLIFDHHLPYSVLPDALLVDPHQPKDDYPFKYLVATAISHKLMRVLADLLDFPFKSSLEKQFLDLVAIATIADVAPLLNENRVLVKFGLEELKDSLNLGLKALLRAAGISDYKKFTTTHVGFVIAPRLNAVGRVEHLTEAGRLEHTDYSFELLMTENENEAKMWAGRLNEFNVERQKQVQEIYSAISEKIQKQGGPERVIFFGDPLWSQGVLGVVAGKLKDEWHRPVFLYSQSEETSLGSSRSINGFNLVEIMDKGRQLLIECGGHSEAAGFVVKNENLEKFHQFLEEQAALVLKEEDLTPTLEIETILEPEEINPQFLEFFYKLEPFGKGNPEPLFLMEQVKLERLRPVGKNGNHLKLTISKNGRKFNVISFNSVEKLKHLNQGMNIDLVFILRENEWQGRKYLDLELVDTKEIKN